MSGEGAIAGVAEMRARLEHAQQAARFDQRPGAFEATRGIQGAPIAVGGAKNGDSWQVLLMIGVAFYGLSAAEARKLAVDLADYAALVEQGWIP